MAQRVVAIGVVGAACYFLQPVLITLCVSILFAFVLAPATEGLQKVHLPRSLAAFLSVTMAAMALYAITYFSYDRAMKFLQDLPLHANKYRQMIVRVRQEAETLKKTGDSVIPKTAQERSAIRVIPQTDTFEVLFKNVGSLAEFLFLFSFIPFLVFFMLTWQDHLATATVLLFRPQNRRRGHRTIRLVSAMIRSFLLGSLLIGLVVGALSTVVFAFMHVPYFYFAGFLSGFLTLVPYLGVVLAPLPPLLAAADMMNAKDALLIVVEVMALHIITVNVLYPKVLGDRLRLNPFVLTMAILFWGWLWGGIGLLLAIPITATMKIVFDHIPKLRSYGTWMGTDSRHPRSSRQRLMWTRKRTNRVHESLDLGNHPARSNPTDNRIP